MSTEETALPSAEESALYHVQRLAEDYESDPIQQSIIVNTVTRMLPELVVHAERKNERIQPYIWQAIRTVAALDDAIHWFERNGAAKPPKVSRRLWEHRPFPTLLLGPLFFPNLVSRAVKEDRARDHSDPNKDGIESATAEYLKYDWHSDFLDWVIVDALVFWECQAFITTRLSGSIWSRRVIATIYAVSFALISGVLWWLGFSKNPLPDWSASVWIILAFIAYLWADGRLMTRWLNRKTMEAMWDGYRALQREGAILSPTRVREELRSAAEKGVVWPNMIWPVLDRVIARNPAMWEVR
jgi:hypothetical protein